MFTPKIRISDYLIWLVDPQGKIKNFIFFSILFLYFKMHVFLHCPLSYSRQCFRTVLSCPKAGHQWCLQWYLSSIIFILDLTWTSCRQSQSKKKKTCRKEVHVGTTCLYSFIFLFHSLKRACLVRIQWGNRPISSQWEVVLFPSKDNIIVFNSLWG